MVDEFRHKLTNFAQRLIAIAPRCTNEESTKLFLILPFLNVLGYDDRNPDEVCPEYSADFSEKYKNRVDFVILKSNLPVIAIECKALGSPLKDERGQLKSYFNAAPTVKMGVITDGLIYEFYADTDEPNMMDSNAFLVVNLREIAKGKIEESVEEGLRGLQKTNFSPENIGAEAKRKLIFQSLVRQINTFADNPSEAFVRMLLQNAGLSHIRAKGISDYTDLTKNAFREFVNLKILRRLDLPSKDTETDKSSVAPDAAVTDQAPKPNDQRSPSEADIEVFNFVRRRLAYLVKSDELFNEIEHIDSRNYRGKFVVFFKKERSGRLFDLFDGTAKRFCFDFGSSGGGELQVELLTEIDRLLVSAFERRVAELTTPLTKRKLQVA